MQTYKGYQFSRLEDGLAVFHPRNPTKPVYLVLRSDSLPTNADMEKKAKRWVTAYRDGTIWAVQEALT